MQMAASKQLTQRKTKARSRVTNGKSLFPKEVDQRSLYYRRFRDLIDLLSADLGGADRLSIAEQSIVRTASTHMAALEQLEMRFALAESGATNDDLATYTTLSNSLRRLLKELGIKRGSKDVTPQSPRDYLRSRIIDHEDEPRLNGHPRERAQ
jgi:hypothetical protein